MDAGIGTIVGWILVSSLMSVPVPGPSGSVMRSAAVTGVLAGVSIPAFIRYQHRARVLATVPPPKAARPVPTQPVPIRPAPVAPPAEAP
jgi:hypothetical protein